MKKIIIICILIVVIVSGLVFLRLFFNKNNNQNKADNFYEEKLLTGKEDTVSDYFTNFPVRAEDFAVPPKMYGLWPYGIKGNNKDSHNEGHPGWDFELKKGSKVYAISDLKILQIHDGDKQNGQQVIKVIEAAARLRDGNYHITYHSVINLEPGISEGAKIAAGEPLAEVGYPLSENTAMIHFGVFLPYDSVGSCPTPYFSPELQEIIEKIVALSIDFATGKPYVSACVGKINRRLYEENFPDRLTYLGGAEQWE